MLIFELNLQLKQEIIINGKLINLMIIKIILQIEEERDLDNSMNLLNNNLILVKNVKNLLHNLDLKIINSNQLNTNNNHSKEDLILLNLLLKNLNNKDKDIKNPFKMNNPDIKNLKIVLVNNKIIINPILINQTDFGLKIKIKEEALELMNLKNLTNNPLGSSFIK